MATLRERKNYREAIMKICRRPQTANASLAQLRNDLHMPEQDLAAACAYLAGDGLITVGWTQETHPHWSR